MSYPKETKIQVTCPATGNEETVYCYISEEPKIIIVNGCVNCNGSTTCRNCTAKIKADLTV